jgi:hypothetical protein
MNKIVKKVVMVTQSYHLGLVYEKRAILIRVIRLKKGPRMKTHKAIALTMGM